MAVLYGDCGRDPAMIYFLPFFLDFRFALSRRSFLVPGFGLPPMASSLLCGYPYSR
jgi:hypothetical protein